MSLTFGLNVPAKATLVGVLLVTLAIAPAYAGPVAGRGAPANLAVVPSGSVADFAAQLSIGGRSVDSLTFPADAPTRSDAASPPTFSGMGGSPNTGPLAGYSFQNGSDWSNIMLRDPGMFGQLSQIGNFATPQTSDRQVIPAPGAVLLASIGAACLVWLKRRT